MGIVQNNFDTSNIQVGVNW